jgi:site-specific DNA-cytosine methylase
MPTLAPATLSITPEMLAAADQIAAMTRPFQFVNGNLPTFDDVRGLHLPTTDLFCGLGAGSLGAAWAGAVPAAGYNHWQPSIDTFRLHHGVGALVDLQDSSAWAHPATRLLIASPDHSGHQKAAGGRERAAQLRQPDRDEAWYAARSRATTRRITEFAEAHGYLARGDDGYQAILIEQILEFGDWPYLGSVLNDFAVSGFAPTFYCIDAAHAGAAARRERVFILLTRSDRPLPDPVLRVTAVCRKHGQVQAVQKWTENRRYWIGAYGRDYHWECPVCSQVCQPVTGRAADIVDTSVPAPTMADRDAGRARPITDETKNRIHAGVDQYGMVPLSVITTRTFRPGKPLTMPLPTLTTQQELGVWFPDPDGDFAKSRFRYLTDVEYAAAAGFPPEYKVTGTRIKHRIRQVGQSSTPQLMADFVARAAGTLL